jgi:hypothetical protein
MKLYEKKEEKKIKRTNRKRRMVFQLLFLPIILQGFVTTNKYHLFFYLVRIVNKIFLNLLRAFFLSNIRRVHPRFPALRYLSTSCSLCSRRVTGVMETENLDPYEFSAFCG